MLSVQRVSMRRAEGFGSVSSCGSPAATMSVVAHESPLPLSHNSDVEESRKVSTFLTSPKSAGVSFGRAHVYRLSGTCGLALWSISIVLWMHYADHRASDVLPHDGGLETKPLVMLLIIGTLMLAVSLLVYSLFRPHSKARTKSGMNSCAESKILLGKTSRHPAPIDLEKQLVGASLHCDSDDDGDDGFVSCEEGSDYEHEGLSEACSICGLLIERRRLPEEATDHDYEARVADIFRQCSLVEAISMDQALRLSLGLNFDAPSIVNKWRETCKWRKKHKMSDEQAHCKQLQSFGAAEVISFPHQEEIYSKAFVVSPHALVSQAGEPVSLWFVGTGLSSASSVPIEHIEEWGRSVFEYADVWAKAHSQAAGRLLGQIQVFDMSGVGFRQLTNSALHERFKHALGCGGNYVELVSHIYVINSSWVFSKIWKMVKPMISPRTASKVTVASDVPKELLDLLTQDSAQILPELLKASGRTANSKVQRPPQVH